MWGHALGERGEILWGEPIKNMAVRGGLLLKESLLDELFDGRRNLRRPLPNARVEHPPMQNAVDRVLRIRMPGQVIQNFRSGR